MDNRSLENVDLKLEQGSDGNAHASFVGRGFGAGTTILRVAVGTATDEIGDGRLPSSTTSLFEDLI